MHRLILGVTDPKVMVDHRDHNGLNNQRANLRTATDRQNQANSTKQAGCSSQYKGVRWCKARNKWRAYIRLNGKSVNLGDYKTEVDAANAYNIAAVAAFGEYACSQ